MGENPLCIALVSGGIDSPVAVARMVRAGWRVIPVHCSQEPITGSEAEDKTASSMSHLLSELEDGKLIDNKLRVVTVGHILAKLTDKDIHRDYFVHMKRLFNGIASYIADDMGAQAILTGENMGQVSSQTLGNLGAIEEASNYRMLRPLLGLDKQEIIDEARKIGTFEISSGPEMCDALGPEKPSTVANLNRLRSHELRFGGLDCLITESLSSLRLRQL
tara:strand:- start:2345 stop:3001 length:657 start_codon:yes stop_codon:yes gene_type:complete